jgi:integrase
MGVKVTQRKGKSGWWVSINHNNSRKRKRFSDKKVAFDFARKIEAKIRWAEANDSPVILSQSEKIMPTLKAYMENWLSTYVDNNCKFSTASGYRQVCKKHLYPTLGSRTLDQVTRKDIKDLVATWNSHALKKRTILNFLTPLRKMYNHAIDDGTVTANPVSKVGMIVKGCKASSVHIEPLTAIEVKALLTTAKERYPFLYPLFLCAVRTGMREGELIGLQWEDMDFLGSFIEVRHNVVRRQETSPKTNRIRRVDLSPQLQAELLKLKESLLLEASMKGQCFPKWVFLTPHGNRMTNEVLRKGFYACLETAGLRRVRFHDLRHTFASLLIQQNANVKYIQQQLGHSSINITLDVYSHLFEGDHRHQVHRLDDDHSETGTRRLNTPETAPQLDPQLQGAHKLATEHIEFTVDHKHGGVTERPNVPVLKTGDGVTHPRVQISPPPPYLLQL